MKQIKFKKKFIIGSANFAHKYGINLVKVNQKEIDDIIKLAKKNKIYKIDTAKAYLGNKKIFKNIKKNFKFITKIKPDPKWISLEFCKKKLLSHFKMINNNEVETILFHDFRVLLTQHGDQIFKNLEFLKKKKYFKKIGLSIYDSKHLNYIISNYNIDVIQCPFNVFDRRILTSGWYDKLKNLNKEIHIRSIFLQGLLINRSIYKNKYFLKWNKILTEWFNFLEKKNISPIDYCLNYSMNYDFDAIVIGINSSKNLKEIINFKSISRNRMKNFEMTDTKLIDPRNWKKYEN